MILCKLWPPLCPPPLYCPRLPIPRSASALKLPIRQSPHNMTEEEPHHEHVREPVHTLTRIEVTLVASGVTVCPWQGPTMAQWEQMSFCSVPQNQSSSDSCSTQSSHSPEKIPDSVSEVAEGEAAPPPPPPPPELFTAVSPSTASAAAAAADVLSLAPPLNTEKMGCSRSIFVLSLPGGAPGGSFAEPEQVSSHVTSSSDMTR